MDFQFKPGSSKKKKKGLLHMVCGMWLKKMMRSIMLYASAVKGIKGQSILESCCSSVHVGRLGDLGSAISTQNE